MVMGVVIVKIIDKIWNIYRVTHRVARCEIAHTINLYKIYEIDYRTGVFAFVFGQNMALRSRIDYK